MAAVLISKTLQAQDSTIKTLNELIVSALKNPQKQSESGKVLTVIGREQIQKANGRSLTELLNTVAGVSVNGANNNAGTNQTLNIRGASAGNALILINGIPVNDPSVITNYFDLNFIDLNQVERIEVLKGGQSTLYGSDAVAGVINIILKKFALEQVDVIAGKFFAGSYGSFGQSVGVLAKAGKSEVVFNYSHTGIQGFSSAYDKNNTGGFDKDGLDEHNIYMNVEREILKSVSLSLYGRYNYYKAGLDEGAFTDDKDYTAKNTNRQAGANLGGYFQKIKMTIHCNYQYNNNERNYLDDSTDRSNPYAYFSKSGYSGNGHFAEAYINKRFMIGELLAGIDYRSSNTRQSYFSIGSFGPYSQPDLLAKASQFSAYASFIFRWQSGFNLEAGGRWNRHSVYGNNFSFTLNPFYLEKNKFKIFGNLYSAFKIPTLYQLYDPTAGNKSLKPEQSLVAEAGFDILSVKKFSARLTGFYRHAKDVILYTFDPSTYASKYVNASRQDQEGLEAELFYRNNKFSVSANYTYVAGKTSSAFDGTGAPLSKDSSYNNLYHIPANSLNISLGLQATKKIYVGARLHAVGKRIEYVYSAPPTTLSAYATVDLDADYRVNKQIKAFLSLRNIFNVQYFDIAGYNSKRFNFTAGVSVDFGVWSKKSAIIK